MPIGKKSQEQKDAEAAAMREREAARRSEIASERARKYQSTLDPARNGSDLLSQPLPYVARSENPNLSEAQKDHLQVASAKAMMAPGKGIRPGKIYRSAAELIRRYLEDARKGAVNAKGQTRLIQMTEAMVNTALGTSPQRVAAYQALMDRAYGKPKPSEEALDAMSRGGIQIVYVAPPEVQAAPERKQLQPKPEFVDAEVVDDRES